MNISISIITATFNAAETIRDCLDSVRNQVYQPVEHIIVDGGSTDKTLAIIDEHKSNVTRILSEPDNGMYDAMNKGIKLATGDIIGIINADDYYANDKVLDKVARIFENPEIDSCYGDIVYVDPKDTKRIVRYWKAGNFTEKSFYRGWMPPHPTFFARKSLYDKYGGFRLDISTSADYELMLRFLLKHGRNSTYIPEVLVHMRGGGVSDFSLKNRIAANRMDRAAWTANDLKPYPWTLPMKPLSKIGQWLVRDMDKRMRDET